MNMYPTGIRTQTSAAAAKSIFNRPLSTLESRLRPFRVSWIKTVYLNRHSMPFRVAVKLPVYICSHTQFSGLSGRVELVGRPRRGMVQIGRVCNKAVEAAIHRHYAKTGDAFALDFKIRSVGAFCLREGKETNDHG